MNYTEVLKAVKNASLFDLYRLKVAISNEIENPARISELRHFLKEGSRISYFDRVSNSLIDAVVIQKKSKSVLVENITDHSRWSIPYYVINLDQVDVNLHANKKDKLSKNHFKIGECVGFNYEGEQKVGIIIRLNQKTATLTTQDNRRWRVSYSYLFKVIDTEILEKFYPKQISVEANSESIV
ncbi:MAG: hypothetical protein JSS53_03435 [Proteobacteria bacterium]|nr:hypothetical protein [Pseudomonadota bacterium]